MAIAHPPDKQFPDNESEVISEVFEIGTVNSILIEKNRERIVERYEGRMNAGRATNIKSASKSVLSLLIGIAIKEGYLESTDQTLGDFFPEYFKAHPEPIKENITLQDLLTMRTGMETTSFRNYGRWVTSSNWIEFTLNRPMEREPGGGMTYSTGTSHLLSAILTEASGMSTLEFANRYLFGPMEIRVGGWDRDPQGYYMGGNNLALRPTDMLKIGRLVVDMGTYNGVQLISPEWIEESLKIYARSNFNPYDYGYMWWQKPVGDYQVFFAWGNGGQYILMVPELDAVITITSDLNESTGSRRHQRHIFDYLENRLLPYLESF